MNRETFDKIAGMLYTEYQSRPLEFWEKMKDGWGDCVTVSGEYIGIEINLLEKEHIDVMSFML